MRTFPATYDENDCILIGIPRALVPITAGLFRQLELRSAWATADDWRAGYQFALAVEECLSMGICTRELLEAQSEVGALLLLQMGVPTVFHDKVYQSMPHAATKLQHIQSLRTDPDPAIADDTEAWLELVRNFLTLQSSISTEIRAARGIYHERGPLGTWTRKDPGEQVAWRGNTYPPYDAFHPAYASIERMQGYKPSTWFWGHAGEMTLGDLDEGGWKSLFNSLSDALAFIQRVKSLHDELRPGNGDPTAPTLYDRVTALLDLLDTGSSIANNITSTALNLQEIHRNLQPDEPDAPTLWERIQEVADFVSKLTTIGTNVTEIGTNLAELRDYWREEVEPPDSEWINAVISALGFIGTGAVDVIQLLTTLWNALQTQDYRRQHLKLMMIMLVEQRLMARSLTRIEWEVYGSTVAGREGIRGEIPETTPLGKDTTLYDLVYDDQAVIDAVHGMRGNDPDTPAVEITLQDIRAAIQNLRGDRGDGTRPALTDVEYQLVQLIDCACRALPEPGDPEGNSIIDLLGDVIVNIQAGGGTGDAMWDELLGALANALIGSSVGVYTGIVETLNLVVLHAIARRLGGMWAEINFSPTPNIITEAQDINTNTDDLETRVEALETRMSSIETKLDALLTILA